MKVNATLIKNQLLNTNKDNKVGNKYKFCLDNQHLVCYNTHMNTCLTITSINNDKIKFIRSLKDKQNREQNNLFVLEGWNIIKDLPQDYSVRYLVVEQNKIEDFGSLTDKYSSCLVVVTSNIMQSISDTKTPCGIMAVVEIPNTNIDCSQSIVVLDNVADPGNVGTIIRSSVACGIKNILAINCADWTSGKVVRSSMGAVLRANILSTNTQKALDMLNNHAILSLDMNGENIYDIKKDSVGKFALVVGSESKGVSQDILTHSKRVLSLPMVGDIESLNAGVALSVALFQLVFGK